MLVDLDTGRSQQRPRGLGDEERVAQTGVVDHVDQLAFGHRTDGIGNEGADVGTVEGFEVDRDAAALLLELFDKALEPDDVLARTRARRRDDQHPGVGEEPSESHQEGDRVAVSLVQVFPHHHDGLVFREIGQQVEHGAEHILWNLFATDPRTSQGW